LCLGKLRKETDASRPQVSRVNPKKEPSKEANMKSLALFVIVAAASSYVGAVSGPPGQPQGFQPPPQFPQPQPQPKPQGPLQNPPLTRPPTDPLKQPVILPPPQQVPQRPLPDPQPPRLNPQPQQQPFQINQFNDGIWNNPVCGYDGENYTVLSAWIRRIPIRHQGRCVRFPQPQFQRCNSVGPRFCQFPMRCCDTLRGPICSARPC
jgi:hypothetical protein